jgi:uncharacterized protein (TIGR02466 family)
MTTIPCFATPVWCIQPENHQAINEELLTYIYGVLLKTRVPADENSSAVGGYQSQKFDFRVAPLFLAATKQTINQVAGELMINPECEPIVTDCWANINYPGSFNRKHTHFNSMLSGVYYPRVPENSGQLVFTDPRIQAYIITLPVTKKTGLTSRHIRRTPLAGEFIIFPSWLEHSVEINDSEEERVSVAFNVVFLPEPYGR